MNYIDTLPYIEILVTILLAALCVFFIKEILK
jgi:hypothetical protein